MAKRMKFSVVGLPHYTVWHLYEPSVDDIRHMKEMAQEQMNREKEEKERAERMKKIKEEFKEPNKQWENDKTELLNMAEKDKKSKEERIVHVGNEQGPSAQGPKESAAAAVDATQNIEGKISQTIEDPMGAGDSNPS